MKWLKNLLPKVTSAEGDMSGFFEKLEAEKAKPCCVYPNCDMKKPNCDMQKRMEKARKPAGPQIRINGKTINLEEVADTGARLKALEERVAALEAERDGR